MAGIRHFHEGTYAALDQLSSKALDSVTHDYGSGLPNYTPGNEATLYYHGRRHSYVVSISGEYMATKLGLPREIVKITKAGGAAHDRFQQRGAEVNERLSEEWFAAEVRRNPEIPAWVAQAGTLLIEGTIPVFNDKRKVIGQRVTQLGFPNKEIALSAMSVACGDFADFYSPSGPVTSLDLYKELNKVPYGAIPEIDSKLIDYARTQTEMAEDYRYPHPTGEALFGKHRAEVVAYHSKVLADLEQGKISAWPELNARALHFMATKMMEWGPMWI